MDVVIKSDPDFEESDTLSYVFLQEELTGPNSVTESETNITRKIEHKADKETEDKFCPVPEKAASNNDTNKLSINMKKLLLKIFKEFGCSQETLEKFASTYSLSAELVLDYFTKAAKDAQDFVYQECDSLSFNNITEWLKYFEVMGGPKDCNYEAAIICNSIANNEFHPEPESMDGVDLKAIYRFLSYALLGLPQEQLDADSAKFLSNEFQTIIDEANTDEADIDVRNMKRKIEDSLDNNCDGKINSESFSLDPLNIAAWNVKNQNKE